MKRNFTELELIRRKKIEKMKEKGISPFSRDSSYLDNAKSLYQKYSKFSKEELLVKKEITSLVGRVMAIRGPFVIGKDSSGKIQAYVDKKNFPKVAQVIEFLDIGDIVKFEGEIMKTKTNVLTIKAHKFLILAKTLKPIPEKFHGLKDVEERYRKRYLDLIMDEKAKELFWTRTKIISRIRKFFDNLGFLEAETPILENILSGAAAEPFETYHNSLKANLYLRIATEVPLKKLLVGGFDKVYEIGRIFRNEGIDTTHNPEFTSIEFYEAYSNLEKIMTRTEEVFFDVAKMLNKEKIEFKGNTISLKPPFKRINMVDIVNEKTKKDFRNITFEEAKKVAKENGIKIEKYYTIGHIINQLFEVLIEETLIEPTFVFGHPIEISPFAKKRVDDERFTERAELFIIGKEYANMFNEINNPIDQYSRFVSQLEERKSGNKEANQIDMDFVEALEYGMPPAGGCGIGIDRLIMLFTGKTSIREVLLFPHLKTKKNKGFNHE